MKSKVDSLFKWKSQFPNIKLSELAQDLLSINPSSGATERNWSTFGYIHSKSRNRLRNDLVEKLVHLCSNSSLVVESAAMENIWFDEQEAPEGDQTI